MKFLGKAATKTFLTLLNSIPEGESHVRVDNTNGVFMYVSVEILNTGMYGEFPIKEVSVSHYYEQNGDLMSDPDVEFLVIDTDEKEKMILPMSFRQDSIGKDDRYITFDENYQKMRINTPAQADLTVFCNKWMQTIKMQQRI